MMRQFFTQHISFSKQSLMECSISLFQETSTNEQTSSKREKHKKPRRKNPILFL